MALDLIAEFEALIDTLEQEEIPYALCGGLAVGIYGHPRATKDIDLLVRSEDVERAKTVARSRGFDIPARKMIFRAGTLDEQEMHRLSKIDEETGFMMPVDFLVVGTVYATVWDTRISVSYGGRTIHVVSRDGLVTMKRRSGRPQDLADVENLEKLP